MTQPKLVKFFIRNLPPQPRNGSHTIRKVMKGDKPVHFLGKTELAIMFEKDLTNRLQRLQKEDFAHLDYFEYSLVVGTPAKEFWTAKGEVSKTSIDFDAHKVFTDVVAKECNFNDGQIVFHSFLKVPVKGDYWSFGVTILAAKAKDHVRTYTYQEITELMMQQEFQVI